MLLVLAECVRDDIVRWRHITVLDDRGRSLELADDRRLVIRWVVIGVIGLDLVRGGERQRARQLLPAWLQIICLLYFI